MRLNLVQIFHKAICLQTLLYHWSEIKCLFFFLTFPVFSLQFLGKKCDTWLQCGSGNIQGCSFPSVSFHTSPLE
uniref:Uncharacterized protein n=1 Tax=Anguilla anguilla TaxID=7936 RepID=A0A0E9X1A1_ANGAN